MLRHGPNAIIASDILARTALTRTVGNTRAVSTPMIMITPMSSRMVNPAWFLVLRIISRFDLTLTAEPALGLQVGRKRRARSPAVRQTADINYETGRIPGQENLRRRRTQAHLRQKLTQRV